MAKVFLLLSSISGFLAVALGAFGAHGLKNTLSDSLLSAFQTGVQYHFYHTLALLLTAVLMFRYPQIKWLEWSGILFLLGIVLFSGSLYAMALGGPRWLGPVTPIGGLCFMAGWLLLAIASTKLAPPVSI